MTGPPPATSAPGRRGAVYDRGYRPYEGELGGRGAARLALGRASVRRALGLRRSWRQKVFPWLLLAVASIPAVVWVGVAYISRDTPADQVEIITYREYLGVSTALLVFVGFAAPDILCPDRRNRTLPLLFARPLTGLDYVVAKVGAITSLLFVFSFMPQVVLYIGRLLVSDSALDYLRDNLDVLWKVPLSAFLFSLYFALLSCAISSLTTRRLVAAASMLILLLGSSAFAAGMSESTGAADRTEPIEVEIGDGEFGGPGDPGVVEPLEPTEEDTSIFGPPSDGDGTVIVVGPDGELRRERYVDPSSAWGAVDLLDTPMHVRDLVFEGRLREVYLAGVDRGGLLAVGVYLLVVVVSAATLVWRYRWLEP